MLFPVGLIGSGNPSRNSRKDETEIKSENEFAMTPAQISVVVCTYNRAEHLKVCLESLVVQTADESLYEVIIVNNNSTDSTLEIAEKFTGLQPNFRVVTEMKRGLSHARNRGCQEAYGEYVAYIDDDARAYTDWVENIHHFIQRRQDVRVFGGPYFAFFDQKIPDWLPVDFESHFLGNKERALERFKEWIAGPNMIFRKDLLAQIGLFPTDLGMVAGKIAYGEDTWVIKKTYDLGLDVFYVPTVIVDHFVHRYKIRLRWMLFSAYKRGLCYGKVFSCRPKLFHQLLVLQKNLVQFLLAIIFHVTLGQSRDVPLKRIVLDQLNPIFFTAGRIVDGVRVLIGA